MTNLVIITLQTMLPKQQSHKLVQKITNKQKNTNKNKNKSWKYKQSKTKQVIIMFLL